MAQLLPDEVLWRIFNLNTPEDEDFTVDGLDVLAKGTSLLTARRTSQVCSKWRTLLLSSSSIWTNALNLEELHNLSAEGRKEVWLRTASSPLSIYGVLVDDEEDLSFNEFFFAILEGHWSRIRRFAIPLGKHSNIVNDPRWSSIYLAAPTLEFFHLSNISDPHLPLAIGPLFSNCAPRLQSLALGNVSFDLRTPSFPRLRDIHLVLDSAFHPRFLWALNGMSNLENVNLTSTEDDDGALVLETEDLQDLPNLNLPKLRDLIVFSNLPFICALISRLTTVHPRANILMNATRYPVSVPLSECFTLLQTGFKRCYEKVVNSGAVDTMRLTRQSKIKSFY
ncbi:hypothetical protein D9613_004659 [Agrocybe pediades]|uniref:F-box domain-containing protein n=1 Tax=Agrocybe pediades TaxID=84607 RepID=A0A8H4QXT7_9AGAR|nr:hypothetical protein D9613_004659 [Agrocybe pediades]